MACFHTLWSAGSVKVMPAVVELVPLYQEMVTFVTVRADCHGMAPLARSLGIKVFPTFILFRGGVEVKGGRIEGAEHTSEKIVRLLNANVTDSDKEAHAKRKQRIRIEKAIALGEDPSSLADEDVSKKQIQLDWTWDPVHCGEYVEIENYGMCVVLTSDDVDESKGKWEYSTNRRKVGVLL